MQCLQASVHRTHDGARTMISAEQNELITRVGPGTPAGKLLRHYWQPVALVDELRGHAAGQGGAPARRGPRPVPRRARPLGLLDRHCPHRGADLAYGRLEDGGLRCPFHGWLFDATASASRRRPSREASRCASASGSAPIRSVEKSGILFAYLGEGEPPAFPRLRLLRRARQPHLRLQGPGRLQLAAGARGRHRSGARLVPAPLLRGRGSADEATASSSAPRLGRLRHRR